jgi:hypothetical protein
MLAPEYNSTTLFVVALRHMAECATTLLVPLSVNVYGPGHIEHPGLGRLDSLTQEGKTFAQELRHLSTILPPAGTDAQHLNEWLQAADYAATALITLLSSVTMEAAFTLHTSGMRLSADTGTLHLTILGWWVREVVQELPPSAC